MAACVRFTLRGASILYIGRGRVARAFGRGGDPGSGVGWVGVAGKRGEGVR